MSFMFRPAARENVGLMIGLIGPSGSGKTYSALRLAAGMAGDKRFCVIDTEAGRAKHYADRFQFDHGDFTAPFSPPRYAEAIKAADAAGYPVIVVDSFSHEHAGDGGILDWQEAELTRMAGDDFRKREAVKMASWVKPKMAHKQMVQKLLQVRAHLILCFRAEEKIEMVRESVNGKMETVVRPKQSLNGLSGWIPVCEKTLPYELTASFLLTPDKPGVPQPIKLQEQHRALFPLGQVISEDCGKGLAAWAKGGMAPRNPETAAADAAAAQKFADADAAGDTQPRMPNGEPVSIVDRAVLLGKIDGIADKLAVPREERGRLWRLHCGAAKRDNADPAALQDLLDALRAKDPTPLLTGATTARSGAPVA